MPAIPLDRCRDLQGLVRGSGRRLDREPWTFSKSIRRGLKNAAYALFALLLAHVFMSYFVSLPSLYADFETQSLARRPASVDRDRFFFAAAVLVRRDVSAAVLMSDRPPYTKGRKWSLAKARKTALTVAESDEIEAFMELEAEHLQSKFGTRPVHTDAEMRLLV